MAPHAGRHFINITKQLFSECVSCFWPISYNDHDTPFTTWETFKRKRENINKSEIQLLFMSLRLISPTTAAMRRGRWLSFTLVSGRDCSRSVNCREHACNSIGIKCWITIGKYTGRLVLLQPWRSQLAPSSFRRHCKWVPRPYQVSSKFGSWNRSSAQLYLLLRHLLCCYPLLEAVLVPAS